MTMIVQVDGLVMMTAMLIVIWAGRLVAAPTSSSPPWKRMRYDETLPRLSDTEQVITLTAVAPSQPVVPSRTEAYNILDAAMKGDDSTSITHTGQEQQTITTRVDNEDWNVLLGDLWIGPVSQPAENQGNPTTPVDAAASVTPLHCGMLSLEERLRGLVSRLECQCRTEKNPAVTTDPGRLPRRPNRDACRPASILESNHRIPRRKALIGHLANSFQSQQNRMSAPFVRHLQNLQHISRPWLIDDDAQLWEAHRSSMERFGSAPVDMMTTYFFGRRTQQEVLERMRELDLL